MAVTRPTQPTAQALIEDALRLIGKLGSGQTASDLDLADGLRRLNDLQESWNLDANLTYEHRRETQDLTANKNPHTVGKAVNAGSAGDFDIVRPLSIEAASIIQNTVEIAISVLSKEKYQGIPDKETTTSYPSSLWYERSFPLGKIHLWPAPGTALKLILYFREQLDTGLLLGDNMSVPPGYLRALRYNLAIDSASDFGLIPPPTLDMIAKESKAAIAQGNDNEPPYLAPDETLSAIGGDTNRRYNVRTGRNDGGLN